MLFFLANLSLMEFLVSNVALFLLFLVKGGFRWFWMGYLHKNIQLMLEFLKDPFLILHLSYYTLMILSDDVICNIAIYADDTIYPKCDQASDLWQQVELASELESNLQNTTDWGRKWLVDFRNLFLRMLELSFSCKLGYDSYIISVAKTASKKIRALIRSLKFLSSQVVLHLYKSTICPCMEYCCHVCAGTPSCYV